MTRFFKLAIPAAALMLAAAGAQAQTLNTSYPAVLSDGQSVATMAVAPGSSLHEAPLSLIQSNYEGPVANKALIMSSHLTRSEVMSNASVNVRWITPDRS